MPARNAKGRFVKSGHHHRKASKSRRSVALVVAAPRVVTRRSVAVSHRGGHGHKGKGKRRHHHHAGVTMGKIILAGVVLGSVAETNNGPAGATVYNMVQKLPGIKTFGGAVTTGLYLGALGKYTRFGRGRAGAWLRAAGVIGLAGAALKIGAQGTKFQWRGGEGATADPYMRVR